MILLLVENLSSWYGWHLNSHLVGESSIPPPHSPYPYPQICYLKKDSFTGTFEGSTPQKKTIIKVDQQLAHEFFCQKIN